MLVNGYILEYQENVSYSTIYKARKNENGIIYTIIIYFKDIIKINTNIGNIIFEGRKIMKELNHPNIIKLIEVKEDSVSYNYICEFCNDKTLSDYIKEKSDKQLSEEIVQFIMKQIVSAVKYLHDKKIVHRDIKPENIFIKYNSEEDLLNKNILNSKIILGGFYASTHLKKGDILYELAGSVNYMAPEIQTEVDFYNEKVDIWSLGILCFVLLHGGLPYKKEDYENRIKYDLKNPLSKEAISFIDSMLEIDQNKRPSAFELSKHKFLTKKIKI